MRVLTVSLLVVFAFILGFLTSQSFWERSEKNNQAGIAERSTILPRSTPTSEPKVNLEQLRAAQLQKKSINALNQQIKDLEQTQNQRDSQLRELEQKISLQRSTIDGLNQNLKAEADQLLQNYEREIREGQQEQVNQAVQIAGLQEEINRSQNKLSKLDAQIKELSSFGIESDPLIQARNSYQDELNKIQTLQANLASTKMQAGQAATLNQVQEKWRQEMDKKLLFGRYDSQIEDARNRLKQLELSRSKLLEEESAQRRNLSALYEKYNDAQNDYHELNLTAQR